MIAAAGEPVAALKDADPTLDAGAEAEAAAEPALPLEAGPLRRDLADRRDDHPRDTGRLGQPLVLRREHAAVRCHQPGRPAEALPGRRQAGREAGAFVPRLAEQTPAADDPALDLLEPQLAPELDRLAGLVADDDLGVRLEQAQDLLARGHCLALEHAAHGL